MPLLQPMPQFKSTSAAQFMHSAIEHAARIMALQSWEEVLMVMLTCAFDVSQDQPLRKNLVMAGFVSSCVKITLYCTNLLKQIY